MLLQFPEKYPADVIVVELKSKTIPPSLLVKMTRLCDQEAKTLAGKSQVSNGSTVWEDKNSESDNDLLGIDRVKSISGTYGIKSDND